MVNLKHVLYFDNLSKSCNKKQGPQERQNIGILSFEVANVMSKVMNLHKSLSENEVLELKDEILKSEGIKTLICSDENQLLELALVEKLDELNKVANIVSRLGKKCSVPTLQGFEHVYSDIVSRVIDVNELGFLVKDMDSMVRKMERYVNSTVSLYREMEVLSELEMAMKKFQQNQHEESRKAYEQKLTWQRQDVRHLKDVSLWNQTYDNVVELLARTVCTVYARISIVFGDGHLRDTSNLSLSRSRFGFSGQKGQLELRTTRLKKSISVKSNDDHHSGPIVNRGLGKKSVSFKRKVEVHKNERGLFCPEDFNFACGIVQGRLFMECLNMSRLKVDDDDDFVSYDDQSSQISSSFSVSNGVIRNDNPTLLGSLNREFNGNFVNCSRPKSRLLTYASHNTIGGSALALHYANIIIVIEKFIRYPHLIGDEARDDLYHMLPTSLRKTLKTKLKSYVTNVAIYDAHLAHDWRERLGATLKWVAPLAHNMIRWQSKRNFEQQQIVTRTNVLLIQTLYFADREKTEDAICEVLVGLNYICRYEQQQNALLDCASSFDLEDCMEWQSQFGATFHS